MSAALVATVSARRGLAHGWTNPRRIKKQTLHGCQGYFFAPITNAPLPYFRYTALAAIGWRRPARPWSARSASAGQGSLLVQTVMFGETGFFGLSLALRGSISPAFIGNLTFVL